MRWLIGLDLTSRSRGPLEFASWLHACATTPQGFVGVHVIEHEHHRMLLTDLARELFERSELEMREAFARAEVTDAMEALRVVVAGSPERGLVEALTTAGGDGMIIGRAAGRSERGFVRLGRVARRLLRYLPKPVVVVAPDLMRADIGRGPILLATDLTAASVPAARFARDFAASVGRELVLVHVDLDAEPILPGEATAVGACAPLRAPQIVDDWAIEVGLGTLRTHFTGGRLVENLLRLAALEDAALFVCGSRGLDLLDRVFLTSTGSDLARLSDRPVVVVPSK